MYRIVDFPVIGLALPLLLVLWLSAKIGGSVLKRKRKLEDEEREEFNLIMQAVLTLLALIIGFSLSMAVSRYDQRKNYEATEANAISTEYVRADFLPSADAARVRALLRDYLDQRILFYEARDSRQLPQIDATTVQLQDELWSAVRTSTVTQPTPAVVLAASGMNEVLDSQGYTQAAWSYRMPGEVWMLMTVVAIFCNVMIGYGSRRAGARGVLFFVVPLVVSIACFLIADIDSPRGGLIRVHPENLTSLSQSLRPR